MGSRKFWTEGAGSFLLAILIALFVRWAFVEPYVIPSGSMLPSLLVNDHIFVNKIIYGVRVPFSEKWLLRFNGPHRGEVVVFKYPSDKSTYFIKRVVGVPGDKVFYENGNLYVNDELVQKSPPHERKEDFNWLRDKDFMLVDGPGGLEKYRHWEETLGEHTYSTLLRDDTPFVSYGPYEVPEGHYFMMGDNRDNSQDSRLWLPDKRFVPESHLMGRAWMVWLSCEETIKAFKFLCSPATIRWSRWFHPIHS